MVWRTVCLSMATFALTIAHEDDYQTQKKKCGYESCPAIRKGVVNIHIVPHTHNDLGWLKTMNQYYLGDKQYIQTASVQAILDSVVRELAKNPERRFIYVETAFLWMWWEKQPVYIRALVRKLVDNGQLELVGGGWSMNDEATTNYQDIVDQFTWGLRKLNDTFGACGQPRVAWQIDTFGHSREFASLLAAMGYDGLFLGRVDYQDKEKRLAVKAAEMLWRGSDDLGRKADIFTSILYTLYSAPPGFCFDLLCGHHEIDDDPQSEGYNVKKKVDSFVTFVKKQNSAYTSENVIITMGGDFAYMEASSWYTNMDKLIHYTNSISDDTGLRVRAFYSTPSCYLAARRSAQVSIPVKEDDFLPYAMDEHSYWTGFYTSRPTLKYFIRRGNTYLQMAKQLFVFTNQSQDFMEHIDALRSAMGVMQHHDAITGTERQHVANDYMDMLDRAIERSLIVTRAALRKLMATPSVDTRNLVLDLSRCQLNISECRASEQSTAFVITVYNPLSRTIAWPIRVPVTSTEYQVLGPDGREVQTQVLPISKSVQWIPLRRSLAKQELIFFSGSIPALGYRSFYVRKKERMEQARGRRNSHWRKKDQMPIDRQLLRNESRYTSDMQRNARTFFPPIAKNDAQHYSSESHVPFTKKQPKPYPTIKLKPGTRSRITPVNRKASETSSEDVEFISNEFIRLDLNKSSGQLTTITLQNLQPEPFTQHFYYYTGFVGDNHNAASRSSGAYVFRPKNQTPYLINPSPSYKIYKGSLVQEIHQVFSKYISQVIRLYKGLDYVEFEWLVGPIPMEDYVGKEIVTKYICSIENEGVFYTDSNGRQMMKRVRNHRPTWKLSTNESASSNYYPVTSRITIRDTNRNLQMSILNDRAQGGTSLINGEIELMLHRRLLYDDNFGVGESLNEKVAGIGLVAIGKHYLSFGKANIIETKDRIQALKIYLQPKIFVSSAARLTYGNFLMLNNNWSGLGKPLGVNVHIMTLEPWRNDEILLRLEHIMQKIDDPSNLSRTATVYLDSLFADLKLTALRETKLAANQWLEKTSETLNWLTHKSLAVDVNMAFSKSRRHARSVRLRNKIKKGILVARLEPMEIRTFIAKVEYNVENNNWRRSKFVHGGQELGDWPDYVESVNEIQSVVVRDNRHTKLLKRSAD